MSHTDKMKFRILDKNGNIKFTGTKRPSWFTLPRARQLVNYGAGEKIVEHDGERILSEWF